MTSKTKRSLFGGALLAAGLSAPAANAQFNFTQSYGATAAYDAFSGQLDTDTFAGAGPFGISSYVGDGYGFAYAFADLSAGPTSIDSNVIYTFDSFTYAGSYLLTYLTASNALGSVTWDFMDQGFINIYEDTGGGFNLVFQNAGNSGPSRLHGMPARTTPSKRVRSTPLSAHKAHGTSCSPRREARASWASRAWSHVGGGGDGTE